MPIYEFECPEGHRTERLFSIKDNIEYIYCPVMLLMRSRDLHIRPSDTVDVRNCGLKAEKIWSIPGNIQIGAPTKVFINNKTGEIFSPFSKYDKPPIGYHEKELRNPVERSKFEKEQQKRTDAENQLTSHVLDSMKSDARKQRHDNLKSKMNSIQREEFTNRDGKTETVEFTLSEKDKALVNKAMEKSKTKPRKEKKTDVKFAINHNDSSNMNQIK